MEKRGSVLTASLLAICLLAACGGTPAPADTAAATPAPAVTLVPAAATPAPEMVGSVEATSMRLERTEGTVSLTDESGAALTVLEKMRLFSGNALATAAESRAGISLDSAKAATLDEESRAELGQDGKKLELRLTEGALYFSVSQPLEADERFDIRTATMTLGIRGTVGYVKAVDETAAEIILTSGRAVITAETGEEHEIPAGSSVTVTVTDGAAAFTDRPVYVGKLPELMIDELREDPEALERTKEEAGLDEEALDCRIAGEPFTEIEYLEDGQCVLYEYDENGEPLRFTRFNADGSEASRGSTDTLGRATEVTIERTDEGGYLLDHTVYTYTPGSPEVAVSWERTQTAGGHPGGPLVTLSRQQTYTMLSPDNSVDVDAVTITAEFSDTVELESFDIEEYAPDGTMVRGPERPHEYDEYEDEVEGS